MKQSTIRLGYLESICQVLALKTENLVMEHHTIWQLFQEADETLFLQLAPHLFTTKAHKNLSCGTLRVQSRRLSVF